MSKNEIMEYIERVLKPYVDSVLKSDDFMRLIDLYDSSDSKEFIKYIYKYPDEFVTFYEEVKKNKNTFTLNNKGVIDLDKIPNIASKNGSLKDVFSAYFSKFWLIFPNLNTALLKEIPSYLVYGKHGESNEDFSDYTRNLNSKSIQNNEYHILLVPEIAKQIGLDCAEYYLAKLDGCAGFSLSPNFLKNGEELVSGHSIVGRSASQMSHLLSSLEVYLSNRHIDSKTIENIKLDFIKQSFFNRFIENQDEKNSNWGIIVNGKSVRIAPIFDIDFSCDIYNIKKECRFISYDDDNNDITSFVAAYRNYPGFIDFVKNVLDNFNIDKDFDAVKSKHNIEIPIDIKENFKTYFDSNIYELQEIYNLCLKEQRGFGGEEIW